MTLNRKRPRNVHDEEIEFMPLSKRINNLHINNGMFLEAPNVSSSIDSVEWGPGPPYFQNQPNAAVAVTPPPSEQNWSVNSLPQYSPEMSESENPHYFTINKLLFEMYVERMQRNGQM